MDIRIYIMSHKLYERHQSLDKNIYYDLHVGRAINEYIGYDGDNTGDAISVKNKTYCELTGLYWVWKNVVCDVAGLAHYRRFFVTGDDEHILRTEDIEKYLSRYDVLLSISCRLEEKSVYADYDKWHNVKDLCICRDVIQMKYPEYIEAFDLGVGCNLFSGGNLFIASKKIFDEYCEWLFSILFAVEKEIDISSYDDYQSRVFGFLGERLLRIFLLARKYKVKEMRVLQTQ